MYWPVFRLAASTVMTQVGVPLYMERPRKGVPVPGLEMSNSIVPSIVIPSYDFEKYAPLMVAPDSTLTVAAWSMKLSSLHTEPLFSFRVLSPRTVMPEADAPLSSVTTAT